MASPSSLLPRTPWGWFRATGAGVVLLALWYVTAYPRGVLMAYADDAGGHHELKVYGLPPRWRGEQARLLEEKYGVRLHAVAGCMITPDLVWYVDGYNSVSRRLLAERHGRHVDAECAELAWRQWQAEHPGE